MVFYDALIERQLLLEASDGRLQLSAAEREPGGRGVRIRPAGARFLHQLEG